MIFNSVEFLLFFPIVFALYWFVMDKKLQIQNALLLVASYVFYGWWDWRFLSLIIISSFLDFYLGLKLGNSNNEKERKFLLGVSLVVNLGFLGFFKYFNFFIDSFISSAQALGIESNFYTLNIILPVGISFYTFQTLSYSIDVYKKKMEPTKDILSFFTFVAFFPQLVAGPIERAKHLLPQFYTNRKFDYKIASSGAKLIIMGFFKKVLVADSLAVLVDGVYNSPHDYIGFPMVVATIFFTFQIYCDFSGYSDIAIGTARLLGFDLMKNFDTPYFSSTLTEFWRRWHISLSTWFRDYVYIPLGGNRGSNLKTNTNIFITFVVSGLWHGANWTFVIWGAIHGGILIFERWIKGLNIKLLKFPKLITNIITFIIVVFAWIFFRANNVSDAFFIISNMFSDIEDYTNISVLALKFRGIGVKEKELITSICFLLILLIIEFNDKKKSLAVVFNNKPVLKWLFYYLLIIFIVFWGTKNSAGNFIYFQF